MDDDIRSRFRGVRGERPAAPDTYGRPQRRPNPILKPIAPIRKSPNPTSTPAERSEQPSFLSELSAPATPRKATKKSKKRKGLRVFLLVIVLLALAGGAAFVLRHKFFKKSPVPASPAKAASETAAPQPTGTIRLVATGDNLAFDSINSAAKKADGSYDYLPMMAEFKPFFDKSDIRLCNETTPGGGDKNGLAISGYPSFNAPIAWSTSFAGLGCNVMNLASDRTNDKGQPAIDAMVDTWSAQKNILAFAGANHSAEEQAKIRYFTVKGLKFAYLAYTTTVASKPSSAYGVNQYSDDLANKQIAEAHKNANLVIVSMNWGTENNAEINADQDRIAQNLANQNADVIIGGGPHVLQPAKVLSGKAGHQTLAWFSLGNFLNSELPLDNLIGGMAVMDFDVASQQIKDPKLLPIYMHYEWTPQQKAAGTINARHDFKLYPLDQAGTVLARSQNNTTVQAQTDRVTAIITKFAPIKVIKSTEF